MLYCPRLKNGKLIPLSWPVAAYRLLNHICWPLRDDAGYLLRLYDRFFWAFGFFIFMQHNDAELRYIIVNNNNLDEMLICGPTYLVLVEIHLRAFQLGLKKEAFKRFLQKFYAEIYIDESSHPKLYANIQKSLRPIWFYSLLYFSTLSSYVIMPVINYLNNVKAPLYKMYYPFDITPNPIYVAIVLSNIWVGFTVITMVSGEDNVLSEVMLHLNGRFLLLQQKLRHDAERLLHVVDDRNIADGLRRRIIEAIEENVRLYKFAEDFEREFSFRIFVNLSFSAGLLCVLGFKVYTTNEMSSTFYECNWELVLLKSGDTKANVRLMKTLLLAISTSQKPFVLTGFKYFSVSLTAVLKILQGAGSYFTFLTSMPEHQVSERHNSYSVVQMRHKSKTLYGGTKLNEKFSPKHFAIEFAQFTHPHTCLWRIQTSQGTRHSIDAQKLSWRFTQSDSGNGSGLLSGKITTICGKWHLCVNATPTPILENACILSRSIAANGKHTHAHLQCAHINSLTDVDDDDKSNGV
ncbi:odorant receptor 74a [Bactrocera neohumeralis]|uniref:odorant receptor 74a n=1 Tax=Bactrocera neohumeralis TaxID=98809 RepID=UPI002165137E|nr:odorant receptor 74a [Bactrocera neohumeralis]